MNRMVSRARSWRAGWLALGVLTACGAGVAARQEPVPIDPRMVLDDLRRAYRTAPVADEVLVAIRSSNGQVRSERIVVRIDAAGVRPDEGPRRVLLELGALRIGLAEGRLVATHTAEPALVFIHEFSGPIGPDAIERAIPPLPVPHLAIAGPDSEALRTPLAYASSVRWDSADLHAQVNPPVATLRGSRDEGPVTLTIHGETGRLLQFSADMPGAGGPVVLELTCRALPPGDPAGWIPSTQGREVVGTLMELRTGRVRPELTPGQPAPDLALLGPDLAAWSLHEALASGARERPGATGPSGVVILFRPAGDAMSDARTCADAVRELVEGDGRRLVGRAAVVMDLGAFSRERFQQLRAQWAAGAGRPGGADDLLWASSAADSLDRLARDAGAAALIVGPDRAIRAIIRLDGRAGDATGVLEELRAALAD